MVVVDLDDHDRVGRAIGNVPCFGRLFGGESGAVADGQEVIRSPRLSLSGTREAIDVRHSGDERAVVRAVPGVVEAKFLVEFGLLNEWQDLDAPAQERLCL